jgi:hypothetical protein
MFSWRHIVLALSIWVSQVLIAPPAASAQAATDTTAPARSDTTARARSDSLAARGDTASLAGRDTTDTLSRSRSDSVLDSLRTAPAAPGRGGAARARSDSVPAAPVDSVLSAACGGAAGSTTIARDLLVVVFAPEASPAERAAAAKSVDGKMLGSAEPGAYYLQVPARGQEHLLRAAADELVQLGYVREVGSRACPPVRPEPTG